eukprot:08727.XXX_22166_22282_1 [CDS] Oithona nana genome sequencing.
MKNWNTPHRNRNDNHEDIPRIRSNHIFVDASGDLRKAD